MVAAVIGGTVNNRVLQSLSVVLSSYSIQSNNPYIGILCYSDTIHANPTSNYDQNMMLTIINTRFKQLLMYSLQEFCLESPTPHLFEIYDQISPNLLHSLQTLQITHTLQVILQLLNIFKRKL